MTLKINWFQEFIVLYQEKNFTNAAKLLNIKQSTLSKHMDNLEKNLNITLIDTFNKKKIYFTPMAQELYPLFLDLMNDYTLIQNTIKYKQSHTLKIGTFPSLHYYDIFTEITQKIQKYNDIQWIESNNQDLYHQFVHYKLDHIIIRNPPICGDYKYKILFKDHYSIFISKKYFLGFDQHFYSDYLFVMLDDLFLIEPIQSLILNKKILQLSNIQTIYSFLQNNRALTILPFVMENYFDNSEFVNIPLKNYVTTIYSISRKQA